MNPSTPQPKEQDSLKADSAGWELRPDGERPYLPAGERMETWNTPFYSLQTRLEICAGAVDFQREVSANQRRRLASKEAECQRLRSALEEARDFIDSVHDGEYGYSKYTRDELVDRIDVALKGDAT
jgi:hypothetical protein